MRLAIILLLISCRTGFADEVDDYINAAMSRQHESSKDLEPI